MAFSSSGHPIIPELVTATAFAQPEVLFVSSSLGHAGTCAPVSMQVLGGVRVYPTSEAVRRHLPGPATSTGLSFSSKL